MTFGGIKRVWKGAFEQVWTFLLNANAYFLEILKENPLKIVSSSSPKKNQIEKYEIQFIVHTFPPVGNQINFLPLLPCVAVFSFLVERMCYHCDTCILSCSNTKILDICNTEIGNQPYWREYRLKFPYRQSLFSNANLNLK